MFKFLHIFTKLCASCTKNSAKIICAKIKKVLTKTEKLCIIVKQTKKGGLYHQEILVKGAFSG
jgi:hypothetical protein